MPPITLPILPIGPLFSGGTTGLPISGKGIGRGNGTKPPPIGLGKGLNVSSSALPPIIPPITPPTGPVGGFLTLGFFTLGPKPTFGFLPIFKFTYFFLF